MSKGNFQYIVHARDPGNRENDMDIYCFDTEDMEKYATEARKQGYSVTTEIRPKEAATHDPNTL